MLETVRIAQKWLAALVLVLVGRTLRHCERISIIIIMQRKIIMNIWVRRTRALEGL